MLYCCAVFPASEVVDFVDGRRLESGDTADGETALCPRCGIDSVLAETERVTLSADLLNEMRAHWF